jgi:hypothetical protein
MNLIFLKSFIIKLVSSRLETYRSYKVKHFLHFLLHFRVITCWLPYSSHWCHVEDCMTIPVCALKLITVWCLVDIYFSTLRGTIMHLNKDINYFYQFTNIEMKGLLLSSVIFGNWRFKCFHMFKNWLCSSHDFFLLNHL